MEIMTNTNMQCREAGGGAPAPLCILNVIPTRDVCELS